MTSGPGLRWFRRYSDTAAPRRRVLVLPHAGGSASFYRPWGSMFPPDTEVLIACYPGRLERVDEPLVEHMDALADAVTDAVLPLRSLPLTLFGHSMGASLAYEVSLRLARRGHPAPESLHVSSGRPPHRLVPKPLHLAGDEALIAHVRRLGGTAVSLLDDPELRELLLPAIRGDFTIVSTYGPREPVPLPCPVYGYLGDTDPDVHPCDMAAWADVAPAGFTLQTLPGGHFYLVTQRDALVDAIAGRLAGVGVTHGAQSR